MLKPLGYFLGGFIAAGGIIYIACQLGLYFVYGDPARGAAVKGIREEAYQKWLDEWVEPRVVTITGLGALICASFCGYTGLYPTQRQARSSRTEHPSADGAQRPLTSDEFQRVTRAAMTTRAGQRSPAFLQGFLVGRFAEDDTELAARINQFTEKHMIALRQDLVDYQAGVLQSRC